MAQSSDRKKYLESRSIDLTAYAGLIGSEFVSRINRIEKIIGQTHEPSVGNFKESILRSLLTSFLPRRYSVGTGFIVFAREGKLNDKSSNNYDLWNLRDHYISRQLDIIVFDDLNFSPLLRDGDFVILQPDSVRAVVEVKGYLKPDNVEGCVNLFVDLGRKWEEYRVYRAKWHHELKHSPSMHLMGCDVYVPPSGAPALTGSLLRKLVVKAYRNLLRPEEILSRGKIPGASIPLIENAFIYDRSVVSLTSYSVRGGSELSYGYADTRGKFVHYNEASEPRYGSDRTVAMLLRSILVSLETPYLQDFSDHDQSSRPSLVDDEFGISDMLTGEDAQLS